MTGSVFVETLRQSWRQMVYWGVGFAAVALMMVLIVPNADGLQGMVDLVKNLPPFMLSMIGVDPGNVEWLGTPEGFVAVGFFGKMLLIMAAYPVVMGMRVTANEEDDGIMDIVVSLPVPRWRVVLEKFLAFALTMIVVTVLMFGGLWLGEVIMQLGLDLGRMGTAVINLLPAMLFILAATTLFGTLLRGKRLVLGAATIFVVASFMLETIGQVGKGTIAESLRYFSIFAYNDSVGVLQTGLVWANILGLIVVAVALVGVSLWAFQRRDVGI